MTPKPPWGGANAPPRPFLRPQIFYRFRLQLGGPRAEELARRRRRAQEELVELLPETALELDPDTIYGPGETPKRGKKS